MPTNQPQEQKNNHDNGLLLSIFLTTLFVVLAIALNSCKSIQTQIVEHHQVDTIYNLKIMHDSVYILDSTSYRLFGDTIYKERFRTVYKERKLIDTLRVTTHDTIPAPYEVIKYEKYIPKFYKSSTIALWLIIAAAAIYIVLRLVVRFYLHK